ncbi:ATP-binding protein [Streptomyces sp. NPDC085946]|uniref:ATP-binding protein n=1 Tax=Streptomyces sp. NPDC085946 TaxID=3365744 RepID=UPI0037CE2211
MKSIDAQAEAPANVPPFTIRLSATGCGARLARRLAVQQLAAWGISYDAEVSHAVALVTAELTANAVTHGRLPGWDFRLSLLRLQEHVRVEVIDARPERLPQTAPAAEGRSLEADAGRGLLLVSAYAERWGCEARDTCTKTVWADIACPH